jgi:hypothetical protein
MLYREEKTLVDSLFNYWYTMMDGAGKERFQAFEALLYEAHEAGELTVLEVENWSQKIQFCPEGLNNHVGLRAWCAYCGDIGADTCDGCHQWFTRWEDPEDYQSILDTAGRHNNGYCLQCRKSTTTYTKLLHNVSTTANSFATANILLEVKA